MNYESIISIILTIVFVIIGLAIKNKNKTPKKTQEEFHQPEPVKKAQPKKLNDFEALLKKLEERKKAEKKADYEAKDDTHSVEYEDIKKIEHHKDAYDEIEETEDEEKDFDLKSAIVYKSILERKKF